MGLPEACLRNVSGRCALFTARLPFPNQNEEYANALRALGRLELFPQVGV